MKSCLFLLVLALVLSCFAGCQQPGTSPSSPSECNVEVVIEGGSGEGFPECLVGRWEGSIGGWHIVFEPDGTISSIVHPIGLTKMKPCEPTILELIQGGKGVYEPGQWTVQYLHDNRELIVFIEMANFKSEIGQIIIEGDSKDLLAGTVSEDCTEWKATWASYPKYIGTTDVYDHYELPSDIYAQERGVIIFRKIAEK